MYYRPEIVDQAFYNAIVKLVGKAVEELITTKRDIPDEHLQTWQEEASQWFYSGLQHTPRNHQYREWFIHRSVLQLTGFDALEAALLHLAFQHHPSAMVTPERLVADKLLGVPPQKGWQRYWQQERKLQAAVAQLIEERGWSADPQDGLIYEKDPFFAGRIMRDDEGRVLVVLPDRDTDIATGMIGPIDSRHLCLVLHDAKQHVSVRTGGIVTMDPHSLAINWHEAIYDNELGRELADLRESVWNNHVLDGNPLPDTKSLKNPPPGDGQSSLTTDQLNNLQFLIMQHRLGKEILDYSCKFHRESRHLLHSFLTESSLKPNAYAFGDCRLNYQLTRDPSRIREALETLNIPLENLRSPLKAGDKGEINRIALQAMLAELKILLADDDHVALKEGVERLLKLPIELGPIDMKKAASLLDKSTLVSPHEINRERLETGVTHVLWDNKISEMREKLGSFYEEQVLAMQNSLTTSDD